MFYILLTLFVIPLLLLAHSYVVFPLRMMSLKPATKPHPPARSAPTVTILMAAYNEAAVLEAKLNSMINTHYLADAYSIWVGSDASTDQTDAILEQYARQYPQVSYWRFEQRTGKPQIINYLAERSEADVLVLTDADALFYPDTLPNLIRPFQHPDIGGVQANLLTQAKPSEQVAHQEINYNQRELRIKKGEGAQGAVIGADGTCYAIRKPLYRPVPQGFYVDDFFIFMSILQQGYKTVFAGDAYCLMQVSGNSGIQFQRKVRISKGNFQNLQYFGTLGNPLASFASYAFFSHKVIRWLGPFLMMVMLMANGFLISYHAGFLMLLLLQLGFYTVGLLDLGFRKLNWYITPLRFVSHFLLMNVALLIGFLAYLTTPADGTWDSTPKG